MREREFISKYSTSWWWWWWLKFTYSSCNIILFINYNTKPPLPINCYMHAWNLKQSIRGLTKILVFKKNRKFNELEKCLWDKYPLMLHPINDFKRNLPIFLINFSINECRWSKLKAFNLFLKMCSINIHSTMIWVWN